MYFNKPYHVNSNTFIKLIALNPVQNRIQTRNTNK